MPPKMLKQKRCDGDIEEERIEIILVHWKIGILDLINTRCLLSTVRSNGRVQLMGIHYLTWGVVIGH